MTHDTYTCIALDREGANKAARICYAHAQAIIANGKRARLTCAEDVDDITIKQRAFLHKAVFPQIEEQYRHEDGTRSEWRVWKEYFRARFLGDRWEMRRAVRWDRKTGQIVLAKKKTPHRVRVSTEDLKTVKAYSDYIDTVIDTATLEMGVVFRFIATEREEVRYKAPPRKTKTPAAEESTA